MRGSFSFQGIDINSFGLVYAPEASDIYVYDKASTKINSKIYDSHAGGYYYGASIQPKVFNLRCYFEDTNINKGLISKINSYFYVGREGRLVFDSRSYIYYNVIVTAIDNTKYLNQKNGYVTFTFTAFYPFGRTNLMYYDGTDENIISNTGLLPKIKTYLKDADTKYTSNTITYYIDDDGNKKSIYARLDDISSDKRLYMSNVLYSDYIRYKNNILLYNAGNEKCSVSIKINPCQNLTIKNKSNGSFCKISNIDSYINNHSGKDLIIDGINGNVYVSYETYNKSAFLYHDSGFITLEPAMPIKRNVSISYSSNKIISDTDTFDSEDIGKFIYINEYWNKIVSVEDSKHATLESAVISSGTTNTEIVFMNEIEFELDNNSEKGFNSIEFVYQHTFS